jgi:hypothetical protein
MLPRIRRCAARVECGMPFSATLKPLAAAACSLLLATAAQAHDTWFAAGPPTEGGDTPLVLGTGNRFPLHEFGIAFPYLEQRGCRTRDGATVTLDLQLERAEALLLRAGTRGSKSRAAGIALTCWAQLVPFDIEITPEKVAVYLDEIAAPQSTRDTWAAIQARGLPWKERYTKHARLELAGTAAGAPPKPAPLGMDLLLDHPGTPPRAGDTLKFQVLRDAAPLPGFAIELLGDSGAAGTWLRTDAQGRASVRVPQAGRWLLRGVDLHPSTERPDTWDSRFVTLAFEVSPAAAKTATP